MPLRSTLIRRPLFLLLFETFSVQGSLKNVLGMNLNQIVCFVTEYSIVKDSNGDLGVIFRFLQNFPITKAVCTKMSKIHFLHFWQYFDISKRKYGDVIFVILNI